MKDRSRNLADFILNKLLTFKPVHNQKKEEKKKWTQANTLNKHPFKKTKHFVPRQIKAGRLAMATTGRKTTSRTGAKPPPPPSPAQESGRRPRRAAVPKWRCDIITQAPVTSDHSPRAANQTGVLLGVGRPSRDKPLSKTPIARRRRRCSRHKREHRTFLLEGRRRAQETTSHLNHDGQMS